MEKVRRTYTVFHLCRSDGSSVFFHPFEDSGLLLEIDDSVRLEGRYGREPNIESFTLLRSSLYKSIDTAVNEWISEARFLPQFCIAGSVFITVFFILSVLVPDPVPLADELLAAGALALVAYHIMGKRFRSSQPAVSKRIYLRDRIDHIVFNHDKLLLDVENILHGNEAADRKKLLESCFLPEEETGFYGADSEKIRELLAYMEPRFVSGKSRLKKGRIKTGQDQQSRKGMKKGSEGQLKKDTLMKKNTLSRKAAKGKIDLSLFVTYSKLKNKCRV